MNITSQPAGYPLNLPTLGPTILSVENISIDYRTPSGTLSAVQSVSFTLKQGEILALIGESGSGKTTLSLGLIRLLPKSARISSGKILFYRFSPTGSLEAEVDVLAMPSAGLRNFRWADCAMVFQSALNSLNPVLKISEHFNDTAQAHGVAINHQFEARAREYLKMVRLDENRVWGSYPHELSGGMRQRVLIALALVLDPSVIIFDEPTTALDILTQRSIINLLKELRTRLNFSMIFVSHDLSLAAELADRVITMYGGQIVEEADVYSTFTAAHHPYTIGLINAVPTLHGREEDLISIPGFPPDLVHLPSGCRFHPRCPLADERCQLEQPPLRTVDGEHRVACWKWESIIDRKGLYRGIR
jgi:peptide/nickel transport system ATP-binding protein